MYYFYLMIESILQAHNETGNIWTHLLPAICCIYVIMIDDLPLIKHGNKFYRINFKIISLHYGQ